MSELKIISYNVNGIRSAITKGFVDWLNKESPDVICLQEIKIARKDFNESIQTYNSSTRSFPTSLVAKLFGFKNKDGFQSDAGAETVTEIKFK